MSLQDLMDTKIFITDANNNLSPAEYTIWRAEIEATLQALYDNPLYYADVFAVFETSLQTMRINYTTDIPNAAWNGLQANVNIGLGSTFTYLDKSGVAHVGGPERILAHELLHTILDEKDPQEDLSGGVVNPNYAGDVVDLVNELLPHLPERASYSAIGNDWIDGGAGADVIDGGGGIDVLHFAKDGAGVTVDFQTLSGDGTGAGGDAAGDTYSNIEVVIGTDSVDNFKAWDGSGKLFSGDLNVKRTAKFPRSLKLIRRYAMGVFSAVFFSTAQPVLADWEGFGPSRTWIIEGTVMSVTPDSFILLSPSGGAEDDIIKLHMWGLKVDADILTMITLARRLYCAVLYDTGEYLGVDCYLSFFRDVNDNPIRTQLPHTRTANGGLLSVFFIFMFDAKSECSRDDEIFGALLDDQSGLHIKCGQNSIITDIGDTE
ncbi:MAG: hypothetical protein L3J37_11600 [Rhodobacteraceae bacterium]|nr:hypothetical protein [Paracoccaceae bacterium]